MKYLAEREAVRQKILDNAKRRMDKVLGKNGSAHDKDAPNSAQRERVPRSAQFEPPNFSCCAVKSDRKLREEREIRLKWCLFIFGVVVRLLVSQLPSMPVALCFLVLDVVWQLYTATVVYPQTYPEHGLLTDVCLSFGLPLRLTVVSGKTLELVTCVFQDSCFALSGFMLTHAACACILR